MKLLTCLFMLIGFGILSAEPAFEAKVYRQGTAREELLFYHHNQRVVEGEMEIRRHFYLLPDSTVANIDEVVLESGEFSRSKAQFLQVDQIGEVIRRGERMILRYSEDSNTKEREMDYPPDLLVGPLFNEHIIKHWSKLIEGEKLYFKLPAADVQRVATFTFRRVEKSDYEEPGNIVFRLDVASIFLKLFVKSSYFVYDETDKLLQSIHGASILPTRQDGKWQKTTDVDIYYSYPER
jgi:hypothetical protein